MLQNAIRAAVLGVSLLIPAQARLPTRMILSFSSLSSANTAILNPLGPPAVLAARADGASSTSVVSTT